MAITFCALWFIPLLLAACGTVQGSGRVPDDMYLSPVRPDRTIHGISTSDPETGPSPLPTPTRWPRIAASPTPAPTRRPTPFPSPTPTPTPTPIPTPTPMPVGTMDEFGVIFYNGFADPRTIVPQPAGDPGNLAALVNKRYALPAEYVPPLVQVGDTGHALHPAAAAAWLRMRQACLDETGIVLHLVSAYRSFDVQARAFSLALLRKGLEHTVAYYALEGRSEHQLGQAVDMVALSSAGQWIRLDRSPAYAWLLANAHLHGYILRYPAGAEERTGYAFEPWHFRYLGVEAAGACFAQGWTLEEYHGLPG